MMFSWLLLFVSACIITKAATIGFGRAWDTLPFEARYEIATYGVVYSVSSTFIVSSARISFAVALLRCTSFWGKVLARVIITGLVCITMIPPVVARLSLCTPIPKVYGHVPYGTCGNTFIPLYVGWASGAWSAASDFALTILAWRVVWSMRMRTKEKIGVAIALSFGLLSGAITIFRYTYVALIYTQDFFQYGYFGFIWMAAEGATSIIAASIPALRAFVVERSTDPGSRRNWLIPGSAYAETEGPSTRKSSSIRSSATPRGDAGQQHLTDYDIIFSHQWDAELGHELQPTSPRSVHQRWSGSLRYSKLAYAMMPLQRYAQMQT
jgi:hypothetical protein